MDIRSHRVMARYQPIKCKLPDVTDRPTIPALTVIDKMTMMKRV